MAKHKKCSGGCGRLTRAASGVCANCRGLNIGRPNGSKTSSVSVVVDPVKCPKCGSDKRGPYGSSTTTKVNGSFRGRKFSAITRRRCRCLACNQARIEKSYLFLDDAN